MKCRLSGTYIYEASCIYPIILFIVFAVFCMSGYVHDCITLNGDMHSSAIESVMFKEDGDAARSRFATRPNGRLFISKHSNDGSACSGGDITLTSTVKFCIFPFIEKYTSMMTDKQTDVKYRAYKPQDFARDTAFGKEAIQKIKDGN